MITVVPYQPIYMQGVDAMMQDIESEFTFPISHPGYTSKPPLHYWVAIDDGNVIGTVGLNIVARYGVLKRMMLNQAFRGQEKGVAQLLLATVLDTCTREALETLYLGTIDKMIAAEKFYLRNGFIRMERSELPATFPDNPIDNTYYKLKLTN